MWNAERGPMAWLSRTFGRAAEPEAQPAAPAAPAAPARQWIDAEGFLGQIGGDKTLLQELTRLFEQERQRRLVTLREVIAAKDPEGIKSAAHAIKSGLTNFCAPDAVALAAALEDAGRAGMRGEADAIVGLGPQVDALASCMAEMYRELVEMGGAGV